MKYLKLILVTFSLISIFGVSSVSASPLTSSVRLDVTSSFVGDACGAISDTISGSACQNEKDSVKNIARNVVSIMSIIVGIIAVIMLIYAGLRFITAGGNANSVSAARNTLIYAVVGIIVAVLAQLLVHFVLNTAVNIQNSSSFINSSVIKEDG